VSRSARRTAAWVDAVPVDLLLLCGIFGNVTDDDIHRTIAAVPGLLTDGGIVIWTRGAFADRPDLRPIVCGWCAEAGLDEVSFDGDPEAYGVGVNRFVAAAEPRPLPARLFEFVR